MQRTAVAVGQSESGFYALKWALDNAVSPGQSLHLLHVQAPLRFIPIATEPVSEDIVNSFLMERFRETETLLNRCRKICEKRQVMPEVWHFQNAVVQNELVDQISKLNITKLVLGTSSHILNTERSGISSFVAKHSPDFCTVIVVYKGKLHSVKDASKPFSSHSLARCISTSSMIDSSMSNCHIHEVCRCNMNSGRRQQLLEADAFVYDTDSIFHNSNFDMCGSEITSVAYTDALLNTNEGPSLQAYSQKSGHAFATSEDRTVEVQELRRQLEQAQLSADKAQREALIQANRRKQAEDFVAKMVKENDIALAEAKETVKAALKDQEIFRRKAAEESSKHQEALADLEDSRRTVEALTNYVVETGADLQEVKKTLELEVLSRKEAEENFRQIAAEESSKHQEALAVEESRKTVEAAFKIYTEEAEARLEELQKTLESEVQLRKEAEEKCLLEIIDKHEALAALRRAQQRYREYSFEELREATSDFQEDLKLGEGGCGSVYKGEIHHTTVAIKVLKEDGSQSQEHFLREVELLSRIHHPHMVMLLGACLEKGCIVYEYMANGSLEDRLNCKDGTPPIPWYVRFRICSEVAKALLCLHARDEPIVHRDLKPGNILLDQNFVSKIGDVGLARLIPSNLTFSCTTELVGTFAYIDPDYQRTGVVSCHSDVYALGIVMLQLLTGKPAIGLTNLVEEAVDNGRFHDVLDVSAGDWPLEAAMQLACLSLQCAEPDRRNRPDLETTVIFALENIRRLVDDAVATEAASTSAGMEPTIPRFFVCPISQEIMEDPHIAADGFTYERNVIATWFQDHDTSPMTNLRLDHKNLIPNFTIRSAIRDWQDRNQN